MPLKEMGKKIRKSLKRRCCDIVSRFLKFTFIKTFALFTIGPMDIRRKANVLVGSSSLYHPKNVKVLII